LRLRADEAVLIREAENSSKRANTRARARYLPAPFVRDFARNRARRTGKSSESPENRRKKIGAPGGLP
jgi:hypothetical protein